MKKIILSIITILFFNNTNAQNEIDALRYSTNNMLGSARYSSMGGAFGSLGGDFSSLSSNPAGLGMYQSSEFTFSPNFDVNHTTSYYGKKESNYKTSMTIGSLGLVSSIPQKSPDWKRINFGIGSNQLANYNSTTTIKGTRNNSIVSEIVNIANETNLQDDYAEMAWHTFLINPDSTGYISNLSNNPKDVSEYIETRGGMYEFIISGATSYQDRLYLGATLGINTINYYEYYEYSEKEKEYTINNLRSMLISDESYTYGTGFNIKVGAIYRVSEKTKVGASVHTPKFLNLETEWKSSITTSFEDSILTDRSPSYGELYYTQYNLVTPLKASVSLSTIINNNILLSGEYEVIDYSTSEFLTTDYNIENENIANRYTNTSNIKLGTEINILPVIFRAGYARYGSPFINTSTLYSESYSYGIGINTPSYFFDIAYILSQSPQDNYVYNGDPANDITLITSDHSLRITLGFRF